MSHKVRFDIITLFPSMFEGPFATSMLKKAQDKDLAEFNYVDLREFGLGNHRTVDDTPYGGGDGMVLKPEPMFAAIESVRTDDSHVVLLCPQGETYRQAMAQELSHKSHIILLCGHYEGYDERIRSMVDQEISIGNYVLTGGEIPAMVLVDSITRLVPGVLGGETSAHDESFSDGQTLEYPQYTRPPEFRGMSVPDVLLSGNHAEIAKWRAEQAQERTKKHHLN